MTFLIPVYIEIEINTETPEEARRICVDALNSIGDGMNFTATIGEVRHVSDSVRTIGSRNSVTTLTKTS